jgi:ABC-type multidrug transport system fused ATPase/permease subunit
VLKNFIIISLTVLIVLLFQYYIGIIDLNSLIVSLYVFIILSLSLTLIGSLKNRKPKNLEELFKDYKGDYKPTLEESVQEAKSVIFLEEEKESIEWTEKSNESSKNN